jgi:carbon monoxide dehydrogenase subunit G
MKIEQTFEVAAPIERLFGVLNDVDAIGQCIAGVKDVVAVSDTESRWKIEARAGFMARTFDIAGTITERRPPSYLAFSGAGQEVSISGYVELEPLEPLLTRCSAVVEAQTSGALAPLVDLMARGPQQALIEQTVSNLRRRLDEEAAAPPAPTPLEEAAPRPAAPAPVEKTFPEARPGWLSRLRRWLASLFGRNQ